MLTWSLFSIVLRWEMPPKWICSCQAYPKRTTFSWPPFTPFLVSLYLPFFLQHMYVYQQTEMNDYTDNSTNECTPCLLNPLLLFLLLLLHQVCCLWWGMASCSSWPTGRSRPWSPQSSLWSTWPSATSAWPSASSPWPSLQRSLTGERVHRPCPLHRPPFQPPRPLPLPLHAVPHPSSPLLYWPSLLSFDVDVSLLFEVVYIWRTYRLWHARWVSQRSTTNLCGVITPSDSSSLTPGG